MGDEVMYLVHDSFKDVFIEVLRRYRFPHYHKMRVRFWNLGFTNNPWIVDDRNIRIMDAEWKRWATFDPNKPWTHPGRKIV